MIWTAKVHTSGSRIQLLKNGSVTKIIRASAETFKPIEAKAFAENLVKTLNDKQAKQMTNPGAKPSIDSKAEEQDKTMKAVSRDAKGISVKEASAVIDENNVLKKKIAHLEKEAMIERKARRGLAIAKALVEQKKIANNEADIKNQVMKIVAMSNDEINLLEKKVAGQDLYNSVDEALIASRRYARMSRLHKQAAEDAESVDNTAVADDEDEKAARYESLAKEAASAADKFYAQMESAKVDSVKSDDAVKQVESEAKGVDAQGKKVASDDDDDDDDDDAGKKCGSDDKDIDEEDELIEDIDDDDEGIDEDEDMQVEAAAAIYRKIASDHKAKAEELKKTGNETAAATELEIAKEADELAENIEEEDEDFEDDDEEELGKEAASIYRKIAAEHRKKADELEAEGKTPEADEEDEIADEAEQLAASVESSVTKTADKKDEDAMKAEMGGKAKTAEATDADDCKKKDEAAAALDMTEKEATDDGKKKDKTIVDDAATTADLATKEAEAKKPDATEDDDALAALLTEDEVKAASAEDDSDDGKADDAMPTDDEIDAAVAGDSDEVEEEVGDAVEVEEKEATSKGTKKIANEGYNKGRKEAYDRIEQNQFATDPQVRELEGLWRHDEQ